MLCHRRFIQSEWKDRWIQIKETTIIAEHASLWLVFDGIWHFFYHKQQFNATLQIWIGAPRQINLRHFDLWYSWKIMYKTPFLLVFHPSCWTFSHRFWMFANQCVCVTVGACLHACLHACVRLRVCVCVSVCVFQATGSWWPVGRGAAVHSAIRVHGKVWWKKVNEFDSPSLMTLWMYNVTGCFELLKINE